MTAYAPVHDDEIEDDTAQLIHRDGEPSSSGADDSKDHPPRVAVPIGKGKGDYALLGALCTSVFFSGCLASVLAPILPQKLAGLRGSSFLKGAIFGAYPMTVALVSLWVPQLSARWGRLFTLLSGIVLEGFFVILFGFVEHMTKRDGTTLWSYLFLRIGMGFGEATQNTVLLAYATDHFSASQQLGQVMGWQETAAGVGIIVGPVVGGLLDQWGGFYLPFLVIGLSILSLLLLMPRALGNARPKVVAIDMTAAGLTMKDFMKFDVINAAVATVLMGMSFGAIMPTLSPHLEKQLKLRDTAHVGMTYMIPALVYGVACPFVGAISDRLGYRKIIAMGFSMLTVAFIMMGPFPPLAVLVGLHGPKSHGSVKAWLWAVLAMVLFGIGGACGFVPTLPAMERGVKTLGPNASDAISGAYWTLYYLGEGVGPFMGTFLVSHLGPGWGFFGIAVVLGSFVFGSRFYARRAEPERPMDKEKSHGVELGTVEAKD